MLERQPRGRSNARVPRSAPSKARALEAVKQVGADAILCEAAGCTVIFRTPVLAAAIADKTIILLFAFSQEPVIYRSLGRE